MTAVMFAQAALDTAVQSDKAPALFDAAADKFQEVSAHGARTAPLEEVSNCLQRAHAEDLRTLPPHFPPRPQPPSMEDHNFVK